MVFTVALANAGPDETVNAVVTDVLPSGVSYVSDDCGGGVAGRGQTTTWIWNAGTIAASGNAVCNITTAVVGPRGTMVSNTASIAVENIEPELGDNSSTSTPFQIGFESNLALTKVSNASSAVSPHSEVVFTLTASNPSGPDLAINVVVADQLPSDLTYVSDTCGAGSPVDQVWTWSVGNLPVGESEQCEADRGCEVDRRHDDQLCFGGARLDRNGSVGQYGVGRDSGGAEHFDDLQR